MDTLKDKIKYYRELKKITKSELSRNLGVSPSYVTMLENGDKKNPSLEILTKISAVLDVPLDELLQSARESSPDFNLHSLIEQNEQNGPKKKKKFNMMDLLNVNVQKKPKGYFLKEHFSVNIDLLTDSELDELINSLKFTIKLKLEEFEANKNK
jgi:Predicted transcriptional regulators